MLNYQMDFPEELKAKILECPPEVIAYIVHLHERIDLLESRVKELEANLKLISRNCRNPPSSDGYAKKNRNTSSSTRKKNPGGQPGHQGNTAAASVGEPRHIEVPGLLTDIQKLADRPPHRRRQGRFGF